MKASPGNIGRLCRDEARHHRPELARALSSQLKCRIYECNLNPLCRHHHRAKPARGWRLEQPVPGVFAWTTPSGRIYITGPTELLV